MPYAWFYQNIVITKKDLGPGIHYTIQWQWVGVFMEAYGLSYLLSSISYLLSCCGGDGCRQQVEEWH